MNVGSLQVGTISAKKPSNGSLRLMDLRNQHERWAKKTMIMKLKGEDRNPSYKWE